MDNVALIKEAYANFANGNMEAVLAVWHPKIEWHECKGMPMVTGDGKHVGHQAVIANVLAKLAEHFDGFGIEISEVFGHGDRVVMVGNYVGKLKATGKSFRAAAAHIWTVRDGKSVKMIQVADTAEIINPKG